jgi:hypothetical protein
MLKWPQGELNKKAMGMGKEEGFEKELEELEECSPSLRIK